MGHDKGQECYLHLPFVVPILNSCRSRVPLLAITILHAKRAFNLGVSTSGAKFRIAHTYKLVPTPRDTSDQV